MSIIRRKIKNIFLKTGSLSILDKINYLVSALRYSKRNERFKKINPEFTFPPDYYLYETYKLDYQNYKEDGEIAAKEIIDWTTKYIDKQPVKILEWGCGVSRIVRHIPAITNDALVFGTDINQKMIDWNCNNIHNVSFSRIDYNPSTHFKDEQFDIVFAISVFTHIDFLSQKEWLEEMHRITAANGIFLFTTHGKKFDTNLSKAEKHQLYTTGSITIDYKQKGHRMMSTYNEYNHFEKLVTLYFEILEYYNGIEHPDKVGDQDLWIVRKKSQ